MKYDNHDNRIHYYELILERKELVSVSEYPLPDGYRFVFYRPGDRDSWIDIEQSAKEFTGYQQGMESWNRYFEGKDEELIRRMVFIENEAGEKVATATAFYDIYGIDQSGAAWLHWVAVRREEQGKRLSKPLISRVLRLMRELGYTHAKVPTQTTTWLACKIYMDLGFVPVAENAERSKNGWRIVKALTNHPVLSEFDAAEDWEISD